MSPRRAYKVVCVSMYLDDIAKAKEIVADLKRLGYTKANVSWLFRTLLNQTDLDSLISKLPPPYVF